MKVFESQLQKMMTAPGFIAALDQSGGSTPKALERYGHSREDWSSDAEMFDLVHAMRSRIMTSPAFTGEQILGAILFENTMDREVGGKPTASYLWQDKQVVPFLKVDRGLAEEREGVQLMKPIDDLDPLLDRAKAREVFGTKMRSVIKHANAHGIRAIVDQQFEVGRHIARAGLVPILEPEVDIHCPEKAEAEALLHELLLSSLDALEDGLRVMFKLTPPEQDNLYADCVRHPRMLKVVALSGGYSREEASLRLSRQNGVVASFSRALTEGLSVDQDDAAFHATLASSIATIFDASST